MSSASIDNYRTPGDLTRAVPDASRFAARAHARVPRLGFLGTGWIGRARLEAIHSSGLAEVTAIADACGDTAKGICSSYPHARIAHDLEGLLAEDLDGMVIATPSAMHAEQAIRALNKGVAVFCQKPLGRNAAEVRDVLVAARRADRLLGVDLSYRHMTGTRRVHSLLKQKELGEIFAAELFFHNAYGPDKPWFYDARLSGGGCLIDLGIHLVDLALWMLDFPRVSNITARLFAGGKPLPRRTGTVEDYAEVRLDLETGATIRIACSWKLQAGCDALIGGSFYGTRGGAAFRNVKGSFYDFMAERFTGTRTELLATGPDDWGGRAALEWVRKLHGEPTFDPESEEILRVTETLDAIYDA